jgi:hypothetical protein
LVPVALRAADTTSETLATVVAEARPAAATYVAVPIAPPPAVGGILSSASGTTAAAINDDWTGLAVSVATPWLLEITSGPRAGWWSRVTALDAATQTATLATALPAGSHAGVSYQLRRLWTIGELFGGTNATAFTASATPSEADRLILVDPTTHAQTTLFYSSVAGHLGWHDAVFAPAENTPLLPGLGVILQRTSTGAREVAFTGSARTTNLSVRFAPGVSVLGAQTPGVVTTLTDSNLLTAGLQGGTSAATADLVIIPQADGSLPAYFYSTATGDTGWKKSDGTAAPTVALPADGAFLINLKSGAALEWQAPASP